MTHSRRHLYVTLNRFNRRRKRDVSNNFYNFCMTIIELGTVTLTFSIISIIFSKRLCRLENFLIIILQQHIVKKLLNHTERMEFLLKLNRNLFIKR